MSRASGGEKGQIPMPREKPIWDKARPKSLGEPKPLGKKAKASARASAAAAGRPYPNLVDNLRAARKK
jgi:hypothetical protein